jgi:hypothetical protein
MNDGANKSSPTDDYATASNVLKLGTIAGGRLIGGKALKN